MWFHTVFQAVLSKLYIQSTLVLTSLSLARISIPNPSACPRDRFPKKKMNPKINPYKSNVQVEGSESLSTNVLVSHHFWQQKVSNLHNKKASTPEQFTSIHIVSYGQHYTQYISDTFPIIQHLTNQNTGITHERFPHQGYIMIYSFFFYSTGFHFSYENNMVHILYFR